MAWHLMIRGWLRVRLAAGRHCSACCDVWQRGEQRLAELRRYRRRPCRWLSEWMEAVVAIVQAS